MEELKLESWKGWTGSVSYILYLGEKKSIAIWGELLMDGRQCVCMCAGWRKGCH